MSKDILEGFSRSIFRYIKDVVDYIEKTKDGGLATTNVVTGVNVISNIYTMSLLEQCSSTYALSVINRAISIYVDFIIQMSNIDSSPTSPIRLGSRDAAQFVYKKVLSSYGNSDSKTSVTSGSDPANIPCSQQLIVRANMNTILQLLHWYSCILRNIVTTLFTHPVFYDTETDTTHYYSYVINKMLFLNTLMEKKELTEKQLKFVAESQYECEMFRDIKSCEQVDEYVLWLKSIIEKK